MTSFKPPYYMVSFTSRLSENATEEEQQEYKKLSQLMVDLAQQQPGFLGFESARDGTGLGITISYWTDKSNIKDWKRQIDHRTAQSLGKSKFYQSYRVRIAHVESDYSFEK
ncbi:yqjZ Uncharacterized protein YqjZ [Candida maltosa Xu316]|uniref:ABM domain-containing protein n=1 Tax=Candida maltosa (strain Xu316) TaxID=1245528 RepID=M3IQW3_CANMX|nr:hypothetical protein G210_0456 [Candida maltosa Xu316]